MISNKVLVVGSGAIGLRTALELLRRDVPVCLRSAHPPNHPSTCSTGAGGLWMPFKCDDPRVHGKWATETLDELLHLVKKSKDTSADSTVEIVPTLYLTKSPHYTTEDKIGGIPLSKNSENERYGESLNSNNVNPLPKWTQDPRLSFQQLTIEMLSSQNEVLKLRIPSKVELVDAGYVYGWLFYPPIVDAPRMLMSMLSEIQLHPLSEGVNIDMNKKYNSIEEMVKDAKDLGCNTVVNCTGMGASLLCGDDSMVGGRGVLLHYDRNCERLVRDQDREKEMLHDTAILIEDGLWGTSTEPCYMIPRGNKVVVGGSYLEGDTLQGIRDSERERLVKNAMKFGVDTEKSSIVGEWTGFRPCRPSVRLEIDKNFGISEDVKVVHSYGHGGSGWTTFVGTAKETVDLLGFTKK